MADTYINIIWAMIGLTGATALVDSRLSFGLGVCTTILVLAGLVMLP